MTTDTLIELFDPCQLENVIAALRLYPLKIVFVGFAEEMTEEKSTALANFLQEKRAAKLIIEFRTVERYNFDDIFDTLYDIVDNNENCIFDLTGGKETVLTAMGIIAQNEEIPMVQFNVSTGEFHPVKYCEDISVADSACMTIPQLLALNGCSVTRGEEEFSWDFNEEFLQDIDTMWGICSQFCRRWNRQTMLFSDFEEIGRFDAASLTLTVSENEKGRLRSNTSLDKDIMDALQANGLLEFKEDWKEQTFRYKNEQVRQCLTKPGNILELYARSLLCEIRKEDRRFNDDIDIGIYVDWDGKKAEGGERDTTNEIDLMMTRDLIPVFISCKNGEVHKEALYELATVAERFGGPYAKKILLASYVTINDNSKAHLLQRAEDMGIALIKSVDDLDRYEFKNQLRTAIEPKIEEKQ